MAVGDPQHESNPGEDGKELLARPVRRWRAALAILVTLGIWAGILVISLTGMSEAVSDVVGFAGLAFGSALVLYSELLEAEGAQVLRILGTGIIAITGALALEGKIKSGIKNPNAQKALTWSTFGLASAVVLLYGWRACRLRRGSSGQSVPTN